MEPVIVPIVKTKAKVLPVAPPIRPKPVPVEVKVEPVPDESDAGWEVVAKPLSKKKSQENLRTKVTMCKFISSGTACSFGKNCFFAHGVSEVIREPCHFGRNCNKVQCKNDSVYAMKGDHRCFFFHPDETDESFARRCRVPVHPKH
jgi:hypothetical protein